MTPSAGRSVEQLLVTDEGPDLDRKAAVLLDTRTGEPYRNGALNLAKTVAALMNRDGGDVLVGVEDDGTVVGVEKDYAGSGKGDRDGWLHEVGDKLRGQLGELVADDLVIDIVPARGHDVAIIRCPRATRPVYLKKTHELFVRAQVSNQPYRGETASDYVIKRFGEAAATVAAPATVDASRIRIADVVAPCYEGAQRLAQETGDGAAVWWRKSASGWLGDYFAFWHKTAGIPAERVVFDDTGERYDATRYGQPSTLDGDNDKAIGIDASSFLSDVDLKTIRYGRSTWNFAHVWMAEHADDVIAPPASPSVFGVEGRTPFPGILGVHTLTVTNDGFVLFALRDEHQDFHPLSWSASFEESVHVDRDRTVRDTIARGLIEEFGIGGDALGDSACLAVGREYVRTDEGRLELSWSVLAAARLEASWQDVLARLDDRASIDDVEEHRAWAGCRFDSPVALSAFLVAARDRAPGGRLLLDAARARRPGLRIHLHGADEADHVPDHGLMPTSAARLVLGTRWLSVA